MKKVFGSSAVVIVGIVIIIFTINNNNSTSKTIGTSENGKYVLNFSLKNLDGKQVDFNQFRGKVIILDVWDTWCPPCKAEIPDFIDLYSEYKDKDFLMIGVALGQEGVESVKKFINNYEINYENYLFHPKILEIFGQIQGIPTTFVIDKNGNLHKRYVGFTEKSVFENDIKQLL